MGWNISYNGSSRNRVKYKTYHAPTGPVAGTLVTLVGLAMLAGGGYCGMKTYELVTKGIHAEGIVADVKQSEKTETRTRNGYRETYTTTQYSFIVDFKDAKGTAVEFKDSMSTSSKSHQKGDKVDVIYLEGDPKGSASINHGAMNWMVAGILGVMGLFITGAGISAFFRQPQPPSASGPDQYKVS